MNEEKKHSLLSRMAYGAADIYGGGAFVVISTFYTVFLTKAQGMPAAMAGTIPLIGKVWDAVTDPIMGNICDRTKSKFGAKRFYILVGSLLSALTFILISTRPCTCCSAPASLSSWFLTTDCCRIWSTTIPSVPATAACA